MVQKVLALHELILEKSGWDMNRRPAGIADSASTGAHGAAWKKRCGDCKKKSGRFVMLLSFLSGPRDLTMQLAIERVALPAPLSPFSSGTTQEPGEAVSKLKGAGCR